MERRHAVAAVVLAALVAGCGPSASPVAPTPPPVAPALQEFRLSGSVSDTAWRPLGGVVVQIVDGPRAGTTATTNEAGRFSFSGTFTGNVMVAASKDGYGKETRPLLHPNRPAPPGGPGGGWEIAFSLTPFGPSANLAGVYSLTLTAASACSSLPVEARTRTYTATIVPGERSTSFRAGLSDARFFLSYNQVSIGVAGDFASVGTGSIVERLDETTYLILSGGAAGPFGASGTTAPFEGYFQYCLSQPVFTSGEYWECQGSIQCDSQAHQLTLVRR